jgi:hypothetical protein
MPVLKSLEIGDFGGGRMLRERAVGESLWEAVLPEELRVLPPELAKVDGILDDDRFLAPFRSRLTSRVGRPTIPIESYLRLMYLKHRYGLGTPHHPRRRERGSLHWPRCGGLRWPHPPSGFLFFDLYRIVRPHAVNWLALLGVCCGRARA